MVLSMSPHIHASKYKPFHHRTFGMFGKLDRQHPDPYVDVVGRLGEYGLVYVDGRLGEDGLVYVDGRLGEYGLVDEPRIHASKYKPFHHRTFGMFGKLDYSILIRMLILLVG